MCREGLPSCPPPPSHTDRGPNCRLNRPAVIRPETRPARRGPPSTTRRPRPGAAGRPPPFLNLCLSASLTREPGLGRRRLIFRRSESRYPEVNRLQLGFYRDALNGGGRFFRGRGRGPQHPDRVGESRVPYTVAKAWQPRVTRPPPGSHARPGPHPAATRDRWRRDCRGLFMGGCRDTNAGPNDETVGGGELGGLGGRAARPLSPLNDGRRAEARRSVSCADMT